MMIKDDTAVVKTRNTTKTIDHINDKIHSMFDSYDLNREGVLRKKEIGISLAQMKLPHSEEQLNELMRLIDSNRDGIVTYDEFKTYVLEKYQQLYEMFEQFDENHDGYISEEELSNMLCHLNMRHEPQYVKSLIHCVDKDRNGYIDFDEWCNLFMMIPDLNIQRLFVYWNEALAYDAEQGAFHNPICVNAKSVLVHLVSGALSGVASRSITAPLERLKILYQTHQQKNPNIWNGIKSMYQEGGLRALWRGNGIHVMKLTSECGFRFFTYEAVKEEFQVKNDKDLTPSELFVAGTTAASIAHTIIFPLEVIKTRINASPTRITMPQMIQKIQTQEGAIAPFFRGLPISLLSVALASATNLMMFDLAKRSPLLKSTIDSSRNVQDPPKTSIIIASSLSTITTQSIFYPMQTIRNRLICGLQGQQYNGVMDVLQKTMKQEGFRGFYNGFLPNLMQKIPGNCFAFLVYSKMKMIGEKKLGVHIY